MALVIFDLDGTLIDSKLDLVHAVNATLLHMGRNTLPEDTIASYVGNGAPVLIRRAMGPGASEAECATALEFFIRHYHDHSLEHTRLYPGVRDALDELHAAGAPMAVLTNKPVRISKHILEGLGVGSMFFQVYGGNSFEQKKPHPVGVERLIEEAGIGARATYMVGDSPVDVETARNAGVAAVGVTYGFQPEALAVAAPDYIIDNMRQLPAIALK